ncbi:fas-associated death domain protein [Epargyreus clarus]|uniref:fas-associated death domain protein n=1 Tax=Epargyreus clarus TaxID=520877 RepID=UPI003C2D8917
MTVSEYQDLKQQIVVSVGQSEKHGQILHTLKEFYKDDIDSSRRYEQITKIGHLLNILEIRDVLSKDNVGPLKEIARRLPNNNELSRKINEYEAAHSRGEYINNYVSEATQNSSHRQVESPLNNHPFGHISNRKKKRIVDTVVEEIGSYWRDLARHLEIREGTIDNIESNNNSLAKKAQNLMEIYEDKADPQRWFFVLCDALESSRRKDLSKTLQNIMAMNI